jgi:hypothetical protein
MNASKLLRPFVLVVCLSVLAAAAIAQAPKAQQFEPTVGQPGKDVVWVPTPQALVNKMLEMAKVTPQDYVIDLGSGDGRTVITAAKKGTKALGIEYNPDMVDLSKRNATNEKVADRATFMKADLFETDFSQASVVTMFLLPDINLRLRPKILEMKPGTRVVSNTFTMGEWEADETSRITDDCTSWCTALLWIVPAKAEGTWKLPQGELKLTQTFQVVSGTLGGTAITNGKLKGDQITFTAGTSQYSGRVTGKTIEGTMTAGGKSANFRADRAN